MTRVKIDMLITPDKYQTKEDYQAALEDETGAIKSHALTVVESLMQTCYQVGFFDKIDQDLKFAEGSIKKARKIIWTEIESRIMNQERQIQRRKEQQS